MSFTVLPLIRGYSLLLSSVYVVPGILRDGERRWYRSFFSDSLTDGTVWEWKFIRGMLSDWCYFRGANGREQGPLPVGVFQEVGILTC